MKKTSTFFLIHNFNMIPAELLNYCEDYIVYDASTDNRITEELTKLNVRFRKIKNTGHNLSTYFSYFVDNYFALPDVICLAKGNMIGRHMSKEFFDRVYNNKYFTYLYEDKSVVNRVNNTFFLTMENQYLEINNSWYVNSGNHPNKFFINVNDLLKFIYKNPIIPKYLSFSPGGCFIIRKEHVLKHSRIFYRNLNKIMTYGMNPSFPSEAHMIERILPIIFLSNYEENPWMNDDKLFDSCIEKEMEKVKKFRNTSIKHLLKKFLIGK